LASRRIAIVVRERVAASGPTSEHRKALIDKIGDIDNIGAMNRLTIEIEPEQHRQIKTLATFAGMTIKEFILSKTLAPSAQESQGSGDTTSRLLGSARNAQRLRDAVASKTPEHLVFETTEDLKRALGI
jgi:hypothetical protein